MLEQLANFHFLRPQLLMLLIPLALLVYIVRHTKFRSGKWGKVCDEQLLPFLLITKGGAKSGWSLLSLFLVGLAIILAFAGPTWEKLPQPVFRSQSALIIAVDLSRSMDVTDIKPSRLTRAKYKIRDILKQRREGQTALIVYAAEAFVVTPLTEDTNTVASLAKNLSTDLMPFQGSYPEKAIAESIELFRQASALNGHVLLITDGIESPDMDEAIAQLVSAGHRLSILGIGTEQGAPIADYRGGFVKSQDGSIVVARIDEAGLQAAALKGSGIYQTLTANDDDINRLLAAMDTSRLDKAIKQQSDKFKLQSDQWREEGPWILLLLLPLIALAFRRGYLVLLIAVLLPAPQTSYAFDWASLWKNQDQRAKSALDAGENQQAAEMFKDPEWKAAASYRAQNYQDTINALESKNSPDAYYNKGNALARMGNMEEAIKSYEQAIKLNPNHEDAKYNRDLVKEYLEKNADKQQNKNNNQQNGDQNQGDNQSQDQSQQQQNQQAQQNQSPQGDSQQDESQNSQQQNQQQRSDSGKEDEQQNSQQADKEQTESNQQDQKSAQAQQKNNDEKSEQNDNNQAQIVDDDLNDEERKLAQKTEQWLRRIPDDPGGLLRRKFRYQSELNSRQAKQELKPW